MKLMALLAWLEGGYEKTARAPLRTKPPGCLAASSSGLAGPR
jgi:hypothetical protein